MQRPISDIRTFIILLLYVLGTACFNVTKPVHIDDTAYLVMAKAILQDPAHPLSQEINWGDTARQIAGINQPLLIPFVYAVVIKVFGESELVLHLSISLFSALAIFSFYLLLTRFQVKFPLYYVGLLALGPSFLPGQNLMVDIPLLAFWLTFFWLILSVEEEDWKKYLAAGVVVALACLTKYTSLVLFPIFAFVILYRRHWKGFWGVGVPVVALVLWSWFNYLDFGGIHLFGRPTPDNNLQAIFYRSITWIAGLGSVSPFAISLIPLKKQAPGWGAWLFSIASGTLLYVFMVVSNQTQFAVYWILFFVTGIFLLSFVTLHLVRSMISTGQAKDRDTFVQEMVLGAWIAGTFAFIVLFSPFIAIRHILLVIPAFLLVLGKQLSISTCKTARNVVSFGLTALLGVLLAISDYSYAVIYRDAAHEIRQNLPHNARIYQIGHWGWEWYSIKAGMLQYDMLKSQPRKDDYLVVPSYVHNQRISPEHEPRLRMIQHLIIPPPLPTWIRTMWGGGYYAFQFPEMPPWRFSRVPFEFVIYQFEK